MGGSRKTQSVSRGEPLTIAVDGNPLAAFSGETVLTAMLAGDRAAMRLDSLGQRRGTICNMGTCCECMVGVTYKSGEQRRARACLTLVVPDMRIETAKAGALD
jgi:sarcosine oxidase subunit alpha